jgi:hypothetical protein
MSETFLTFLGRGEVLIAGSALAAFLVLSWVLRGTAPGRAAEGETDADAPLAWRRDRMVFGVAFGLVLILAGAFVAIDRGVPWSLPIFAVGFGLVLVLTRINRRYRHSSPILRRTIDVSGAFLDLSLLAGVLIVLNVLAFRYGGHPLDLTREGTYTLTQETVSRIRSLDRPLTFTLIAGQSPLADRHRARVEQLLESYRSLNPQLIRVTSLNPYEDLVRLDELSKRVPQLALLRGGGVLIEYGDDKETAPIVVRSQELFDYPSPRQLRGGDRFDSAFTGEDAITSAIDRLRQGKGVKVAFTTGHGEAKPDDMGGKGLGNWRERLARVGYEVSEIRIDQGDIPDDLALLIVVGPQDPFKPEEAARLRAYADRGKPVLLLLGNEHRSGLDELLKAYNLEIGNGLVLDPKSNYNGNWEVVGAPSRAGVDHPIASAMSADRGVLLPHAAPIRVLGMTGQPGASASDPVDKSLVPTPILKTGRTSWAETDLKTPRPTFDRAADVAGPVTVGVAIAKRQGQPRPGGPAEEQPRLVLFSCPMMADNALQDITPANLDLLMNTASWLRGGRPDTLGLSPRTHTALTLSVDPQLRSRLILVPTATAAMLIIAMGIIVYISRRE